MPSESPISVARHHIVGVKTLAPAFFLGLTQAAALLSLYLLAAPAPGSGFGLLTSFLAVTLAAWGCGARFWGRAIDGEGSLAPRLLALTQGLAAFYWLAWPWLLPLSARLGAAVSAFIPPEAGLAGPLGQALALAPLLGPPAFLCGGAMPLLAEMGLKKQRRLEWNLPLAGAFRLAGLAAGFTLAALAPPRADQLLWGALAAGLLLALCLPLLAGKPEDGGRDRRLWPPRSLGLWSGEAINVLDHDLTKNAARPAWLVSFLSTLSLAGYLGLWIAHFGFFGTGADYDFKLWWVYPPAFMALGAIVLAPQLSRPGSPSSALALAAFLAALGLLLAPPILDWAAFAGPPLPGRPELWGFMPPALALGTLWPLAGQVLNSRRHWLASSLGLASLWVCLGGAAGLLLSGSGMDFHRASLIFSTAALLAAFTALTPLLGRLAALAGWILAVTALWCFVQPKALQPNYQALRSIHMNEAAD